MADASQHRSVDLGRAYLTDYPHHVRKVFQEQTPPSLSQKLLYAELVDKENAGRGDLPRLLCVSNSNGVPKIILANHKGAVRRWQAIAKISSITTQEYYVKGLKCKRLLVKIPQEKDLLFFYSPRKVPKGRIEAAAADFIDLVTKVRELQTERGVSAVVWEGVVHADSSTNLRSRACLKADTSSEYINPEQWLESYGKKGAAGVGGRGNLGSLTGLRSQSAPLPHSRPKATSLGNTSTVPADTHDSADLSDPDGLGASTPQHRQSAAGPPDMFAASPVAPEAEHGSSGSLGRSPCSPVGTPASDLEAEIKRLRDELSEKENCLQYLEKVEQHCVALRATNSWMEEQLREKSGRLEDIEAQRDDLEKEVAALKALRTPSPTSPKAELSEHMVSVRLRKVSFVEGDAPKVLPPSVASGGGGGSSGGSGAARADERALKEELNNLNSTIEELQKSRTLDEERISGLKDMVSRVIREKEGVEAANAELQRRLEASDAPASPRAALAAAAAAAATLECDRSAGAASPLDETHNEALHELIALRGACDALITPTQQPPPIAATAASSAAAPAQPPPQANAAAQTEAVAAAAAGVQQPAVPAAAAALAVDLNDSSTQTPPPPPPPQLSPYSVLTSTSRAPEPFEFYADATGGRSRGMPTRGHAAPAAAAGMDGHGTPDSGSVSPKYSAFAHYNGASPASGGRGADRASHHSLLAAASPVACCSFHSNMSGGAAVSPVGRFRGGGAAARLNGSAESMGSAPSSCPDELFVSRLLDVGMMHDEVERLLRLSVRRREHLQYVTYEELTTEPCSLPPPLARRLMTAFGYGSQLPSPSLAASPVSSHGGKSPPPSDTKTVALINSLTRSIIDGTFTGSPTS
eukprot:Rhum_TRINITY_DN14910_c13_g1::Rhum_TRINITY_DN14910_c13_g1_i1::g.127888::m.127888